MMWLTMQMRKALATVYLVLGASGLSLLALGPTAREANCTHGVQLVQHYCPTAATPVRFINGVCKVFLHPSLPGLWLPVLKANSNLMQLWNIGSNFWGRCECQSFESRKVLASLCLEQC